MDDSFPACRIPAGAGAKGCKMKERVASGGLICRAKAWLQIALLAATVMAWPSVVSAQAVERFDPNDAYRSGPESGGIDADLAAPQTPAPASQPDNQRAPDPMPQTGYAVPGDGDQVGSWTESDVVAAAPATPVLAAAPDGSATYGEDDLIGAAEGVFGKGAEGLAKLIEDLLAKQGRPNGYIIGREAGGALVLGARYGSGTLHHKVEGERKVYWTGPSVGFDAGANAGNTFVLVYNLYDSQDLYTRFAAGEGQAYFIGGFHASYLRRGDIVLIPIRVGAGLRLGINAGYMRFSQKQRWLPF
jgi:hypothetical protein